MIDFTQCEVNKFRAYGGANGNKINIRHQGEGYMLKFPPVPTRSKTISCTNSCISEYLACHIFELLGIKAQETLLGTYTDQRGREKLVVACKDFTEGGKRLMEFAQLKNACINSEQSGYGTDLRDILQAIEEQTLIPAGQLKAHFWDMFIADALLGNFDRHNGNWGILVDEESQTAEIAPVYDCGSCLYPQLGAHEMQAVLEDEREIKRRIYEYPTSAIMNGGAKISYPRFIASLQNEDCNQALERISARIDMEQIEALIRQTPGLLPVQRDFYEVMIRERKEQIIDCGMAQLMESREHHFDGPRLEM